jgi:hypothetical protein
MFWAKPSARDNDRIIPFVSLLLLRSNVTLMTASFSAVKSKLSGFRVSL